MSGPHADSGSRVRTAALSVAALGVVFGDIGTSPLYALRESLGGEHDLEIGDASVLGVLSLIFWSLVLVVTVKYLVVVMRADNEGEGGILALTALVSMTDPPRRPLGATRARVSVRRTVRRMTYGFVHQPDLEVDLAGLATGGVSFDPEHCTHFLGREHLAITPDAGMATWREHLFEFMHRNASDPADHFGLPADRTIDIGSHVEL